MNQENQQSQVAGQAPKSGMAITGFVLGAIALLTSFLPIINNASFILAVLGLVFAIVGFAGINKGKKSGKGLAIAALIICVVSGVVVLATQTAYSNAIDEATSSTTVTASSADSGSDSSASSTAADVDFITTSFFLRWIRNVIWLAPVLPGAPFPNTFSKCSTKRAWSDQK